jgi:biotin transport system substrate-specific component
MSYARALPLEHTVARDLLLVLLACFAISLSGRLAIPLWFTPVPIATQNSVVLLLATFLGPRRAVAATLLFLAQGAFGLPIFSTPTGLSGPTAGYLIGYLLASFVVGSIAEKSKTLSNALFAMLAGHLIVYACGVSYLATFIGLHKALLLGAAPFILGDLCKTLFSLSLLKWTGWDK